MAFCLMPSSSSPWPIPAAPPTTLAPAPPPLRLRPPALGARAEPRGHAPGLGPRVVLLEPGDDDRRVEPAGVGEGDGADGGTDGASGHEKLRKFMQSACIPNRVSHGAQSSRAASCRPGAV